VLVIVLMPAYPICVGTLVAEISVELMDDIFVVAIDSTEDL
jgi:hypothetical protein